MKQQTSPDTCPHCGHHGLGDGPDNTRICPNCWLPSTPYQAAGIVLQDVRPGLPVTEIKFGETFVFTKKNPEMTGTVVGQLPDGHYIIAYGPLAFATQDEMLFPDFAAEGL